MNGGGSMTYTTTAHTGPGSQFPGPVATQGEGAEGAAGPHYTQATGVAAARQVCHGQVLGGTSGGLGMPSRGLLGC